MSFSDLVHLVKYFQIIKKCWTRGSLTSRLWKRIGSGVCQFCQASFLLNTHSCSGLHPASVAAPGELARHEELRSTARRISGIQCVYGGQLLHHEEKFGVGSWSPSHLGQVEQASVHATFILSDNCASSGVLKASVVRDQAFCLVSGVCSSFEARVDDSA